MSKEIYLVGRTKFLQPEITKFFAIEQLIRNKDIARVYPAPASGVDVVRRRKPQIQLCFLEDSDFVEKAPKSSVSKGRRRKFSEISFRLMDESTDSISKATLKTIANQIKSTFAANDGFVWRKGKEMYSYSDWDLGYQLQLLCRSKTAAKEIVTKVLGLQGHAPDWTLFGINQNDNPLAKYPENPPNKVILGESVRVPRKRPKVDVRFQYAIANIHHLMEPIALCDRGTKLINPLAD